MKPVSLHAKTSRFWFRKAWTAVFTCVLLLSFGVSRSAVADEKETFSVGDSLTATWDPADKTLTVAGHGTLDRDKWGRAWPVAYEPNFCGSWPNDPKFKETKRIKFVPDAGQTIDFPQDSSSLFKNCNSTEIEFPREGINTSNVTNMETIFSNLHQDTLEVSNWDVRNVTNMGSMFWGSSIKHVDMSKWNTGNVTDMSNMFIYFNSDLCADLDISKWNTGKVKTMASMFESACINTIDVSKWNTATVENMTNMFNGAEVKKDLDISGWVLKNDDYSSIFNTYNQTILKLKGNILKSILGDIHFKSDTYYHIRDLTTGELLNKAPFLGNQVSDMPSSVKDAIRDDHKYMIQMNESVTVTAKPAQVWEGEALPALKYEVEPAKFKSLVQGEVTAAYTAGTAAGDVPITVGTVKIKDSEAGAYNLTFKGAMLTVLARPAQPQAEVSSSVWADVAGAGGADCAAGKVNQTRSVTTVPFKWDSVSHKWVKDEAGKSVAVEKRMRDMNDGELKKCAGAQPQAEVSPSSDSPAPKASAPEAKYMPNTGASPETKAVAAMLFAVTGILLLGRRKNIKK